MRRVERTVADEVKGTEMKQAMPDALSTGLVLCCDGRASRSRW